MDNARVEYHNNWFADALATDVGSSTTVEGKLSVQETSRLKLVVVRSPNPLRMSREEIANCLVAFGVSVDSSEEER